MTENWLHKNIVPILALSFVTFTFILYMLILTHTISASDTTTTNIVNSDTNITLIIIGYYFGRSKGSKDKQEALDKISNTSSENNKDKQI